MLLAVFLEVLVLTVCAVVVFMVRRLEVMLAGIGGVLLTLVVLCCGLTDTKHYVFWRV